MACSEASSNSLDEERWSVSRAIHLLGTSGVVTDLAADVSSLMHPSYVMSS